MKLATAERKTHWSDVDTGGYTALDFALRNSHMLNTNVFMQPPGGCSGFSSTPLSSSMLNNYCMHIS